MISCSKFACSFVKGGRVYSISCWLVYVNVFASGSRRLSVEVVILDLEVEMSLDR